MCFHFKVAHHCTAGILRGQFHGLTGGAINGRTTGTGQMPGNGLDYLVWLLFPWPSCAFVPSFMKWDTRFFLAVEVRELNNSLNT